MKVFAMNYNDAETIERIFETCRTIAVVGLSSKPRPSKMVAEYMQRKGYKIVPVNPREREVLGEKSYGGLKEAKAATGEIDLVNVFRRSAEAGAVVDEAIAIGARAVWLQDGVIDEAAAKRALDAGLMVVMDRCWLRDYARR